MQHVPYGGGSPATVAVLRGEVQMLLAGSLAVGAQIQSGGLKPLAIASAARTPAFPNLPTFREQGIDFLTGTWFGLLAPARTPPDIIALLNREVLAALRSDSRNFCMTKPNGCLPSSNARISIWIEQELRCRIFHA
jgi:tripartite-type tricarboxylate transporter receptor subunit TctC